MEYTQQYIILTGKRNMGSIETSLQVQMGRRRDEKNFSLSFFISFLLPLGADSS